MKITINQLISKLEEARQKVGGNSEVKLWNVIIMTILLTLLLMSLF